MEDFQDFQIIDNCLMVRMPEEVDHHRASYICEGADRLLVRENVENVVFDFEDTRFMDSSGIGIIMGRYRKISCFGGHVYAIHTDRQIQRIFRMSGLHKIVEIREAEQRHCRKSQNMKEIMQKNMKNSAMIGAEMRRTWWQRGKKCN